MTSGVHALVAVATAALLPSVVRASQSGDAAVWLAAVMGGLLPNALEWLDRALTRADALYTPDPAKPPEVLADEAARTVARFTAMPLETGRALRLRVRPLPSGAGRLSLRFLGRCCSASVSANGFSANGAPEPPHSSRVPDMRPIWPAEIAIEPPDGALLEFRPDLADGSKVCVAVRSACRGRGLAHSVVILGVSAAALLALGIPWCAAAGAGLLVHGALDAVDLQGIPVFRSGGRMLALRLLDGESRATRCVANLVGGFVLAAGLVLHTAYLGHGRRLVAVALAACALFLLFSRLSRTSRS